MKNMSRVLTDNELTKDIDELNAKKINIILPEPEYSNLQEISTELIRAAFYALKKVEITNQSEKLNALKYAYELAKDASNYAIVISRRNKKDINKYKTAYDETKKAFDLAQQIKELDDTFAVKAAEIRQIFEIFDTQELNVLNPQNTKLFITICDTYDINGYISIHYLTKMCQSNNYDLMIILPERKGIVDKQKIFTKNDFKVNDLDYTYETNIGKSTRVMKQSALLFNKVFQQALEQKPTQNTFKPKLYIIRGTVNKLNTYDITTVIDEEEIYKDLIIEDKTQIYTYYTVEEEDDLLNMLSAESETFTKIINYYFYTSIIINLTGSSGFYDILKNETRDILIAKIKNSKIPIFIFKKDNDHLQVSKDFLTECSKMPDPINIILVDLFKINRYRKLFIR